MIKAIADSLGSGASFAPPAAAAAPAPAPAAAAAAAAGDAEVKVKKARKAKDPDAPKRPRSAFFLYAESARKEGAGGVLDGVRRARRCWRRSASGAPTAGAQRHPTPPRPRPAPPSLCRSRARTLPPSSASSGRR